MITKMKTELLQNNRQLQLLRYPERQNETLQAWDAGDEYLIEHVEKLNLPANSHLVIINDSFGALSCWFSERYQVSMMSDSYIAQQATLANLARNQCHQVRLLTTMDPVPSDVAAVLVKIPKSNRHLTWLLDSIRQQLNADIPVISVNKAREIHTSTLKLFEKHLGKTHTSLAQKKHRLVFSVADATPVESNPYVEWPVDGENYWLKNLPNVYSGENLDQGARFILPHLPQDPTSKQIIDLGCGNGVLSIKLGQLNPYASIIGVDESHMAIASATLNIKSALGDEFDFEGRVNNCLDGFDSSSADLIVCNPPFHQQLAVTDHIAWQMFCDAKQVLKPKGKLMVIGNRHLGYDNKLARLFGKANLRQIAVNKKFVILQATK